MWGIHDWPRWMATADDHALLPVVPGPDDVCVMVAGGPASTRPSSRTAASRAPSAGGSPRWPRWRARGSRPPAPTPAPPPARRRRASASGRLAPGEPGAPRPAPAAPGGLLRPSDPGEPRLPGRPQANRAFRARLRPGTHNAAPNPGLATGPASGAHARTWSARSSSLASPGEARAMHQPRTPWRWRWTWNRSPSTRRRRARSGSTRSPTPRLPRRAAHSASTSTASPGRGVARPPRLLVPGPLHRGPCRPAPSR